MQTDFGQLEEGRIVSLYTISRGRLTAKISDLGATLVELWVPDKNGDLADVVLGFDRPQDYIQSGTFFGATVGRNANRVKDAAFVLGGKTYTEQKARDYLEKARLSLEKIPPSPYRDLLEAWRLFMLDREM